MKRRKSQEELSKILLNEGLSSVSARNLPDSCEKIRLVLLAFVRVQRVLDRITLAHVVLNVDLIDQLDEIVRVLRCFVFFETSVVQLERIRVVVRTDSHEHAEFVHVAW